MSTVVLPLCPVEGFTTVEVLGSGGNGDVTKIVNNETGEEFALKILRRIQDDTYQRCRMKLILLLLVELKVSCQ